MVKLIISQLPEGGGQRSIRFNENKEVVEGKGREGKGREGKGREGKGREGKGLMGRKE